MFLKCWVKFTPVTELLLKHLDLFRCSFRCSPARSHALKGFVNKILLGHDCQIFNQVTDLIPEAMLANMPDWNLTGLFRSVIPHMKEIGITEEHLHTMLVDNPRRFFAGE